jgi:hypothetical protein
MNSKRKNNDFTEAEVVSRPSRYGRDWTYRFYVDATPLHCIDYLHQLESKSEVGTTYRVITSDFESGYAVEIYRSESTLDNSTQTLVTVYVSPYDVDNQRTFVVIRTVLVGPILMSLMMFLGVACLFMALMSLAAGSLVFVIMIPIPFVPAVFFVPNRLKSLNIVAKQLLLLRKDASSTTEMKLKNDD